MRPAPATRPGRPSPGPAGGARPGWPPRLPRATGRAGPDRARPGGTVHAGRSRADALAEVEQAVGVVPALGLLKPGQIAGVVGGLPVGQRGIDVVLVRLTGHVARQR